MVVMQGMPRETAWSRPYGQNTWLYPNWPLDLRDQQKTLIKSGYACFVQLIEPVPRTVQAMAPVRVIVWKCSSSRTISTSMKE